LRTAYKQGIIYGMELSTQIILKLLEDEKINITLSLLDKNLTAMFANTCYAALSDILKITLNDILSNFEKVGEILCVFDKLAAKEL